MTKTTPDKYTIRSARAEAGLTQTQAAALVYHGLRSWQHWEAGERAMQPAIFELFLIKTGLYKKHKGDGKWLR